MKWESDINSFNRKTLVISFFQAESSYKAQSRLEGILLKNYSKETRPVLNHTHNVTVTIGISLSRIHDMVRLHHEEGGGV